MTDMLHIVCPHCQTTNRVRSADLVRAPDCGQCHRPLFTGEPIGLDADAFERQVQRSHVPVLVDFWAPWCGPCRMMAPAYAQAAAQLEPRVRMAKLNMQEAPQLGARLQIRSIPTLALFHQGRELARQSEAMGTAEIVRWTEAQLRRAGLAQGLQSGRISN